jgi:PAS domain S-box-containing protein
MSNSQQGISNAASQPPGDAGSLLAEPGSREASSLRLWGYAALFVAAYFLAHQLAFFFPDSKKVIMAVWPAGGVGLAAFLLLPLRLWPALVVGFYAAGVSADVLLAHRPFLAGVGYMTGNMVESVGCAALILHWGGSRPRFDRVAEVLALTAGVVLVNALSACIGAAAARTLQGAEMADAWTSWYIADGLGVLLITPLIVTWVSGHRAQPIARRAWAIESAAFMTLWCVVSWLACRPESESSPASPHPYMLIGLLAWPGLRLGQRTVSLALAVLAGISIVSVSRNGGASAFGGRDVEDALLSAQLFLGTVGVFSLLFAAGQAERQPLEAAKKEYADRLQAILDNTPSLVYLKDIDGRFLLVNRPFARLFRSSVQALTGKTSYDIVRPDLDETHRANDLRVMETGLALTTEELNEEADGMHTYLSVKFPLRDAGGRVYAVCGISTDITPHKRIEASLREGENRLILAKNAARLGIYDHDVVHGTIQWDDRVREIWGVGLEEPITYDLFMAGVHPEDRARTQAAVDRAFDPSGAGEYFAEYRVIDPAKGRERWVAATGQVTFAEGRAVRNIGTVQDITEGKRVEQELRASRDEIRRMLEVSNRSRLALLSLAEDQQAAEAALRESEEKFSKAFHDAPVLISITDIETAKYVDVNQEALRISGFARDEVIGHTPVELGWITAEDRARLVQEMKDRGRIDNLEMAFRAKDGRTLCGLVNGEQIRIGQRPCLLTVTVDVTVHRQAEESLRRSQQDLANAQGIARLGSWRASFKDGQESWTGSDELHRLYGYNLGMPMTMRTGLDRMHPDDREAAQQAWSAALAGQGPSEWDHRIVVDGQTKWIHVQVQVHRDEKGRVIEVDGTNQDITEQKRLDLQLVDYHMRLRSLASRLALTEERERRNLAERLHDDVSQYLAFCKMKLEMVRRAEKDPSLVTGLTQVCDTLSQLLADTRAMTFDLYSPVLKVLGFEAAVSSWLREEVGQKHGIRTEFNDDRQPKPLDDNLKALVFRSVRELLHNAIKHANADLIRVSISREGEMLCIEVEDDGQGLVPEEAISQNAKGFGLFSIQERLAELEGSMEIDTAPGEGCRVVIRVPLEVRADAQV